MLLEGSEPLLAAGDLVERKALFISWDRLLFFI